MIMNDPRMTRSPYVRTRGSTGIGWAIAAVVALALIGVFAWTMSDNTTVATRDNAPVATTGQGQRAPAMPAPNPVLPTPVAPTPAPARRFSAAS